MRKSLGKWLIGIGVATILVAVGYYFWPRGWMDPKGEEKEKIEQSLLRYDFDSLRQSSIYKLQSAGNFKILGNLKPVEDRRKQQKLKYDRQFDTREISFESDGKKVSGMINYFPEKNSLTPVIIMVRGYAEKAGYYPGSGSWRVADKLAEAGYATVSLDFLGYGNSDGESIDPLEARFHKVAEVLDLINAVKQLPWVDKTKIGIWAHSNGGQIVLSVLEITGEKYPAVLWAPMTQPFPDSVLSTIDVDSPIKQIMEDFEKHYDARRYAFENYYQWINAPILIQQGTIDDQVKLSWQEKVVTKLKSLDKDATLDVYEGSDHNLTKGWKEAVERDIGFFADNLR
ncbi:alpha/beta fold hydrolase [Candidatus Shapirobacteria bacterium]|nr:alpha/beta fold hydrolase [Candidatus Shapirobacteria bacterium]